MSELGNDRLPKLRLAVRCSYPICSYPICSYGLVQLAIYLITKIGFQLAKIVRLLCGYYCQFGFAVWCGYLLNLKSQFAVTTKIVGYGTVFGYCG